MHEPLLLSFAAVAAGVLAERYLRFETLDSAVTAAAFLMLALIAHGNASRRLARVCLLAGLAFAGCLTAVLHRPGPPPEIDAGGREIVTIEGCVVEPPVMFEDREQLTLELAPDARARVSLYTREGEALPNLAYGRRIEFEGKIRRTHNFQNPGSFDYAGYLGRRNIFWTASGNARTLRLLPGTCGNRFDSAIFRLRGAALDRLERFYSGDAWSTAMTQAILIGEGSRLEKAWTEGFRRTGTYHAIIISGLHVTVLAGFLLCLLRLCFVRTELALLLTALAAWLYALVSGWQAPVVRSAGGFTLYLIGRYFYRERRLLNLLAAVAIAFVVLDPGQLFDASFQLSFLSVAAIGGLAVPLLEATTAPRVAGLRNLADREMDLHLPPRAAEFRVEMRLLAETACLWTRLPERFVLPPLALLARAAMFVWETLLISAAVQIGLALPMIVYFHRMSITGLSANVVVVPLMTAAVPVGFVAIFTDWRLSAALARMLLIASRWVVERHVAWEPQWRIPDPPLWLALAVAAALIALAVALRHGRAIRWPGACVLGVLFVPLLWHPFAPRVEPGKLEVTAIDVGQGDSLLAALPSGKLMLIDAGGIPVIGNRRRPRLDIGEDVVSPYLWSRSIKRLDVVAVTHLHEDHAGGMAAVIDNFRPRELWTGAVHDSPEWTTLRERASARGVRVVPMLSGRTFDYGGARFEVLAPAEAGDAQARIHNNDSLVLRLTHGRRSFLLTGDIEQQVERRLAGSGGALHSDVLKVPHHGSPTSSSDAMLGLVRPAFALISAGFENSYNNPHPDVLRRLEERQTRVLRTDRAGLISVVSDGWRMRVETWAGEPGRRPAF